MNVLNLKLRFSTPVFSRGADPKKFEITPQSIKGLMRFWYRALLPNVIQIHKLDGKESDYAGMKFAEELLFGSTNKRSAFDVITKPHGQKKVYQIPSPGFEKYSGTVYASYGMETNITSYLPPNSEVELEFVFKKTALTPEIQAFILSLWELISTVGGIGAKSRKGYGSFEIVSCTCFHLDSSQTEKVDTSPFKFHEGTFNPGFIDHLSDKLLRMLKKLDPKGILDYTKTSFTENPPPFPVLSHQCWYKKKEIRALSWHEVMNAFFGGQGSKDFPSTQANWKPYRKVKISKMRLLNNKDCVQPVRAIAYDRYRHITSCLDSQIGPSIFGLPLLYQNLGEKPNNTGSKIVTITNSTGRKASPVFINIRKIGNHKYLLSVLVVPSQISIERDNNNPILYALPDKETKIQILGNENYNQLKRMLRDELENM